ncbi:unnamed protein product [Ixodes persulcatus]
MCQGARIIVTEPSISSKDFLETLAKYHVSVLSGIPERLREIIREARSNNYPEVDLEKIIVTGTSFSKSLGTEICKFFGVKSFVSLYDMTETSGILSCTPVEQITMDNVGFPSASSKVKILDLNSGGSLGPHQKGEIVVQSRNLMKSYYNYPEDTRHVISNDGWFRTGDVGYYDENGRIYIVERLKQMIKCVGNVVTPAELEDILTSHEAVLEAAVVGIPSPKYGEAPTACVVVKESKKEVLESLERELKEVIAGQTSFHKHLYGGIVFMETLPKSDAGKILRQVLKSCIAARLVPYNG